VRSATREIVRMVGRREQRQIVIVDYDAGRSRYAARSCASTS